MAQNGISHRATLRVAGLGVLIAATGLAAAPPPASAPVARPGALQGAVAAAARPVVGVEEQERFLREAEIVKGEPIGKGVTKPWKLTLRDGDRVQFAAFQSIDRTKDDVRFKSGRYERRFRDYYGYNIAAYRLARLLGYDDLVPASVPRSWRRESGAITWWVDKKWDEDERVKANIAPPDQLAWEQQVYRARVFTALVDDTDRNLGNQLVTADFHLWMIDFTRAFRHSHELTSSTILRRIDRKFLEALKTLPDKAYRDAIGRWLDTGGVDALLARRTAILKHFADAIAQRGESSVLFD
jgi:hypothetical protein